MSKEEIEILKAKIEFLEKENKLQDEMIFTLGRIIDAAVGRMDVLSLKISNLAGDFEVLQEQGKDDCKWKNLLKD